MNARTYFVYTAVLLMFANVAFGEGAYQRTKPGKGVTKSLVWNNHPTAGDAFTWSGKTDKDGYATGEGTLTWYRRKQLFQTGANLPFARQVVAGRYTGKMIRGKLNGSVVKVDDEGHTFHGKFVDGQKTGDWSARPAPSPSPPGATVDQPRDEPVQRDAVVEVPAEGSSAEAKTENVQRSIEEPPAEGPSAAAKAENAQHPKTETPTSATAATDSGHRVKPVSSEYDDSLRELLGPPSKLRGRAGTDAPPKPSKPSAASAGPRLAAAEVVELADAEARAKGYDLSAYERPQLQYAEADNTWSVVYAQKNDANGIGEAGKQFSVNIEDKTKKTSVVPGQ
jgi:hypothetical protein